MTSRIKPDFSSFFDALKKHNEGQAMRDHVGNIFLKLLLCVCLCFAKQATSKMNPWTFKAFETLFPKQTKNLNFFYQRVDRREVIFVPILARRITTTSCHKPHYQNDDDCKFPSMTSVFEPEIKWTSVKGSSMFWAHLKIFQTMWEKSFLQFPFVFSALAGRPRKPFC